MTTIALQPPRRGEPHHRIITLTGLFWAFSYVLLSIRGALFFDDWTRLIDDNRLLTVTAGAGAYALVLRQLEARRTISFSSALTWIIGATVAVLILRMTIDQMLFERPQGVGVSLLYSLSWSSYFGLWVMGSLAFGPPPVPAVTVTRPVSVPAQPASRDGLELLIDCLLDEAAALKTADQRWLAERVLAAGGYESADGNEAANERARLAVRIAARLAERD